ncbi:cellulose synthase operon protein YhjQ/BcsQ [uncultured Psychrosphaera sp.]|uniref:cellulose synthase operon protein YhjQ/BcsQ n=1 Tax=uncultured Psychrosphaera sp. TaxID=1403522 RepID=UPI0030F9FB95
MAKKDFKLVVVQGIKGGVGCTTITSNLAVALTKVGFNVLVFDFCKNNDLRLHFGMGLDRFEGFHKSLIENTPWLNSAFSDKNETVFFPFGQVPHTDLNSLNSLDPNYFNDVLNQIDFESKKTIVLVDYPSYSSVSDCYFNLDFDLKLTVGTCEVSSYSKLSTKFRTTSAKDLFVINRYNPENKLESDIRTLISTDLIQLKLLGVIFEDEFIHQALAQNTTVVDLNEFYKSSKDFYHLAMRLNASLFDENGV